MLKPAYLEYRCPRCGFINAIARDTVIDMYKEQLEDCQHCQQKLEIIAANGINDKINLIVFEQDDYAK
ncbi:hypothetical protein [Alteromonas lipolytica]|uniref:CPXCG motif-containing cysteine-rich protein n=1 Tax=Alteromonas lipolytica TaxID=1856405 RepID=A0A1E8F9A3_9ALTE|nr:hypothetical protein [Alteromonas lipolytica]OFI32366.1 hypothetical protein BFC17_07225 [Alteromonas lipolytica]GGF86487.1 hypothetical protein GCM10011338_43590 [Alteromonas lipolytica]